MRVKKREKQTQKIRRKQKEIQKEVHGRREVYKGFVGKKRQGLIVRSTRGKGSVEVQEEKKIEKANEAYSTIHRKKGQRVVEGNVYIGGRKV